MMDEKTGEPITKKTSDKIFVMESHSADLEKVKTKIFVGVCISKEKVYSLACDGHVYVFDTKRSLVKWMNIKVERAFGCQVSDGKLFCACSEGVIRIF